MYTYIYICIYIYGYIHGYIHRCISFSTFSIINILAYDHFFFSPYDIYKFSSIFHINPAVLQGAY
jgi:hypothetical protein